MLGETMAGSKQTTCQLCGQPLGDPSILKRYEENLRRYEDDLRQRTERALRRQIRSEVRETFADKADAKAEKKIESRTRSLQQQIETLREQVEYHRRKAEKLSSVDRGAFNEQDLLLALRHEFHDDKIEPHKRGQAGTDIIHDVRYRSGVGLAVAGRIVYECKDRLTWSKDFVSQAKAAKERHQAAHAVVVSRVLPRKKKGFTLEGDIAIV